MVIELKVEVTEDNSQQKSSQILASALIALAV